MIPLPYYYTLVPPQQYYNYIPTPKVSPPAVPRVDIGLIRDEPVEFNVCVDVSNDATRISIS